MAITIDGTNGFTFNDGTTQVSAGKILQVVSTNFSTLVTVSGTLADVSNFSASITPKLSTSKILITVSVAFGFGSDTYPYILLKRNGTSIFTGSSATGSQSNVFLGGYGTAGTPSNYRIQQPSKTVLDSPATTSSITYQIAAACPFGQPGYINRQGAQDNAGYIQYPTSTITLMEVAA